MSAQKMEKSTMKKSLPGELFPNEYTLREALQVAASPLVDSYTSDGEWR